jgi:predicted Fe-Mo cluster-binding NifX family protein
MKIAIPIWNERISPVFDVAQKLAIMTVEAGDVSYCEEKELGATPYEKIRILKESNVSLLICGAISGPLMMQIRCAGIEVVFDICGPVSEVVEAFLADQLGTERFMMPGCCRRRRRFRGCGRRMQGKLSGKEDS